MLVLVPIMASYFRSTSWSLLRRSSTTRRSITAFTSRSDTFWSIWSIEPQDQLRYSLHHVSDHDFRGCTGSPLKRPQSSPVNKIGVAASGITKVPSSTFPAPGTTQQGPMPSPILRKTLFKVNSDSSLPSTPSMGREMKRHNTFYGTEMTR